MGGFQYRLHNGMPELSGAGGIAGIKPTDLDTVPVMPAASMLVRILPHTEVQPFTTPQNITNMCKVLINQWLILQLLCQYSTNYVTVENVLECDKMQKEMAHTGIA